MRPHGWYWLCLCLMPCDVLWHLAPASPESLTALVTGAGARTRARSPDGAGRCPARPVFSAVTDIMQSSDTQTAPQIFKWYLSHFAAKFMRNSNFWRKSLDDHYFYSDLFKVFNVSSFYCVCKYPRNLWCFRPQFVFPRPDLSWEQGKCQASRYSDLTHHESKEKGKDHVNICHAHYDGRHYTPQPPFYSLYVNRMSRAENNNMCRPDMM